eukprot:jgi/Bigna1/89424/estExt_fgenesh1_pg.C_490039
MPHPNSRRPTLLAVFDNDPRPGCFCGTFQAPCGVCYTPLCPYTRTFHCLCNCCLSEHPCWVWLCCTGSYSWKWCCGRSWDSWPCGCGIRCSWFSRLLATVCCSKNCLTRVRRTRCSWWTPCLGCARPDDHLHEKIAQHQLASRVLTHFQDKLGYEIIEYTLEDDLRAANPIPDCDIAIFFIHDWPTIHEDPNWLNNFVDMLDKIPVTVPTKDQVFSIFTKTNYLSKLLPVLRKEGCIQPTEIVSPESDLDNIVEWALQLDEKKVVTKENFSAGKEGVTELKIKPIAALKEDLRRTRLGLQETSRQYPFFDPNFIIQKYEKRFLTEPEVRIFYSNGVFLYAISHVGWVGDVQWPVRASSDEVKQELKVVKELVFTTIPALKKFPLLRIDFGPQARLNEIEMWPDMFGGPNLNLTGSEWSNFLNKVAEGIIAQSTSLLATKRNDTNKRPLHNREADSVDIKQN